MKAYLVSAFVVLATAASGNIYVPDAKLAGETVHVRLLKNAAAVTAVFEFDEWIARDTKVVYFPIFAEDAVDPVEVLVRAGLELEIAGKKVGPVAPCDAPGRFKSLSTDVRVYWFCADVDDLFMGEDEVVELTERMVIKVSYTQPFVRGRFYYLPIIAGTTVDGAKRSWHYQMLVRSDTRVTRVLSAGTDYEQVADAVVVYLKDGQIVEIQ